MVGQWGLAVLMVGAGVVWGENAASQEVATLVGNPSFEEGVGEPDGWEGFAPK
jgi:hypothetical protein